MRPHHFNVTPCAPTAQFLGRISLSDLSPSDLDDCRAMAFEALADANRDGTQDDIDQAEANVSYLNSIIATGSDDDLVEFDD